MAKSSSFKGIRAGVLTVSDSCSRNIRKDASGEALVRILKQKGARVVRKTVVPDDKSRIKARLKYFCGPFKADLVLTTGGTGLGPRDVTPEATKAVLEKEILGLTELMRLKSYKKTERAALSRATAGVRGKALIINLPGSPKGASGSFRAIANLVPHALAMIRGEGH